MVIVDASRILTGNGGVSVALWWRAAELAARLVNGRSAGQAILADNAATLGQQLTLLGYRLDASAKTDRRLTRAL